MVGADSELGSDFVGDHTSGAGFSVGHGKANCLGFSDRGEEQGFKEAVIDDVLGAAGVDHYKSRDPGLAGPESDFYNNMEVGI